MRSPTGLLERRPAAPPRHAEAAPSPPTWPRADGPEPPPARWRWLFAGFLLASISHMFLPGPFVWVLCALPHEMGHATVGCLLGHPSAPAISLSGHAWTGYGALRPWLVWVMAASMAFLAWHWRGSRLRCGLSAALAIALPAMAFSSAAELAMAAGGHLGELAFAAYCYCLCWTGGRTGTPQERIACSLAGALLQTANVKLCLGLMTDAGARAFYATNGSLGLKNDYLVIAEDLCRCKLQSVAMLMLLLSLAALPAGLLAGWWRSRNGD